MIRFRAIRPKPFDPSSFRKDTADAMRDVGDKVVRRYERTVKTWEGAKPTFKVHVSIVSFIRLIVALEGDEDGIKKWNWLNEGTAVRRAIMSDDWQSKTTPDDYNSGPGQGRVVFISKDVAMPGIEARHWSKMAAKEFRPQFNEKVQAAYKTAARKSGHGRKGK